MQTVTSHVKKSFFKLKNKLVKKQNIYRKIEISWNSPYHMIPSVYRKDLILLLMTREGLKPAYHNSILFYLHTKHIRTCHHTLMHTRSRHYLALFCSVLWLRRKAAYSQHDNLLWFKTHTLLYDNDTIVTVFDTVVFTMRH